MGKTAFVTGGTGFVGSHLVDELLRRGYSEVRCLVRTEEKWLAGKDVVVVRGDLSDEGTLTSAVTGVDYVYHVAAMTRATDDNILLKANVEGPLRLLRAIRSCGADFERVLITSSLAVVGSSSQPIADENTPLHPVSRYGKSKAAMETSIWGADADGRRFADVMPITLVRPPAVYGPREQDIYTFFKAVSYGLCPIVGGGNADPLSLVYVSDLVKGMADAAESSSTVGETYFLGSARPSNWHEIRDATVSAVGRGAITVPVPRFAVSAVGAAFEVLGGLVGKYPPLNRDKAMEIVEACKACSSAKAAAHFGYEPRVSLEEGISTTIEWYRQQGWLS